MRRISGSSLLGGALGAGACLIIVALLARADLIGILNRNDGLAAWAQGLFSVGAIGAAIWIAQGETRRQDRERAAVWEVRNQAFKEVIRNCHLVTDEVFKLTSRPDVNALRAERAADRAVSAEAALNDLPLLSLSPDQVSLSIEAQMLIATVRRRSRQAQAALEKDAAAGFPVAVTEELGRFAQMLDQI